MMRPTTRPKKKILVVDDDRVMLDVTSAVLRQAGYDVRTAQDALQGTMVAQRERPALVLLDLQMPAGGGEQTWRRLGSLAGTAGTPVVICTASSRTGIREEMLSRGAAGFLGKPFTDDQLLSTVADALDAG